MKLSFVSFDFSYQKAELPLNLVWWLFNLLVKTLNQSVTAVTTLQILSSYKGSILTIIM